MTPEDFAARTYDYIIVGGGTAGLALAARLTEDPTVTVGVIEAGGRHVDAPGVTIPGMAGSTLGNPSFDWAFMTIPQKHANNRPIYQPRGKGLGGSSMINFLGYHRASAREYDALEALGNTGWNWKELLKYFKKAIEPKHGADYGLSVPDTQMHGTSGPIVKAYSNHFDALHLPLIEALETLGVPKNPEPDNGHPVGTSTLFCSVDSRNATRSYAGNAYYEPSAGRLNLAVLTESIASRILFRQDATPLIATGVEFLNADKVYTVSANKEVILCAGAFQSPQLLELSGIGNKEVLGKHGIETLVDLPAVGENLQDHPYVYLIYEIDSKHETVDLVREPEWMAKQVELYKTREGFLSSAATAVSSFLPAKAFATEEQMRRWKETALKCVETAPKGLKKQLQLQLEWFHDPSSGEAELIPFPGFFAASGLQPMPQSRYSSMVCAVMHPLSRGSVHVSSKDPKAPPAIDPNYFSNPVDMEVLLATVKFALKLYETSPIKDSVIGRIAPTAKDCASDEALVEYIKNGCGCVYHPLGTASMLPREDGGVVDPELRVYGTANVRVVDASILPMELAAHIQATVYAVAEKAADIIKQNNK
ncbi:alcohol oxidase [Lentinus brumalis]|uniref:Alcohol oxidase n=1 Tax=Lentinus brumalis TaxID=2498619 RepID=A0A371DVJ8_9APHY|nr:alcohol oxidase [Polyporus brumalis]